VEIRNHVWRQPRRETQNRKGDGFESNVNVLYGEVSGGIKEGRSKVPGNEKKKRGGLPGGWD